MTYITSSTYIFNEQYPCHTIIKFNIPKTLNKFKILQKTNPQKSDNNFIPIFNFCHSPQFFQIRISSPPTIEGKEKKPYTENPPIGPYIPTPAFGP